VVVCEQASEELVVEMWLMSCRVLGRQVEDVMMNAIVEQARKREVRRIFGRYVPTARNGMVREHYRRMGFELVETAGDGTTLWRLEVESYLPRATQIACFEAELVP
jgi:predicted enzyme involved in methoxymalonyl-ACP biosynthesis